VPEPSENGVVVNGWRRAVFRLGAAAGIAGPAAFTGAWIASSLRQTRQGPGGLQLSGLAAPDARDPWIMLAGFLVTGGCTVAFGAALRQALRGNATRGAGPGPALIQGAGLLTVAAGLLRRDHMLLNAPGEPGASWHSNAHDAISGLVYVNLVAAQLALAWRFGRDPAWRHWRPWLLASAAATGVILIAYATDVTGPAAAILQPGLAARPVSGWRPGTAGRIPGWCSPATTAPRWTRETSGRCSSASAPKPGPGTAGPRASCAPPSSA
jgi:hypothetical protein